MLSYFKSHTVPLICSHASSTLQTHNKDLVTQPSLTQHKPFGKSVKCSYTVKLAERCKDDWYVKRTVLTIAYCYMFTTGSSCIAVTPFKPSNWRGNEIFCMRLNATDKTGKNRRATLIPPKVTWPVALLCVL